LHDEPTLNLRWKETAKLGGDITDALLHWGFNAGNVQTYVNTGATVRLGRNLHDYGTSPIGPARPESREAARATSADGAFTGYLSVGFDVRAVGRNIFLDGNSFKDSPSVDKKPLVIDGIVGLTIAKRPWSLSYLTVWRSPEFKGQYGVSQKFGSIVFSIPLW
jgi:hypothetical protein